MVESLWTRDLGHHRHEYSAHIKTGHIGNHHHWSVVWITKTEHHEEHIETVVIEEGKKTFFWSDLSIQSILQILYQYISYSRNNNFIQIKLINFKIIKIMTFSLLWQFVALNYWFLCIKYINYVLLSTFIYYIYYILYYYSILKKKPKSLRLHVDKILSTLSTLKVKIHTTRV